MERKGLRVNMGKTKIMVSGPNLDLLKKNLERTPVAFVRHVLEEMLSFVVAACPGSTKNAVDSKAQYALILTSDVLAAWEKHVQ